jgi:membrane protein DedA with SNARE-associated domain
MAGWKIAQSGDAPVVEWLTDQPWTFVGVMVAATVGAALGSLAGYLIGAWGGRPLLDRYGRYIHIYPDDLDRADAWFARYGGSAVFLARFVPLLRALINYPAGVARMPIGRFLLFSILGCIPWNLALVTAGWVLGENYEALYEAIRPFEIVIYVIVVVGIAVVLFRWVRGRAAPRQV